MKPIQRLDALGDTLHCGEYKALPTLENVTQRQLHITIVTNEFATVDDASVYGHHFLKIAQSCAEAGHKVTVIYSRSLSDSYKKDLDWTTESGGSVNIIPVEKSDPDVVAGPSGDALRTVYYVYSMLSNDSQIDVVHAPDRLGLVYFCLAAKKAGLAFQQTQFVTHATQPLLWRHIVNAEVFTNLHKLIHAFIERKTVELADHVVSSSPYMLDWMVDHGYDLNSDASYVHAKQLAYPQKTATTKLSSNNRPCIAYVGDITAGSGAHIFIDAINRVCNQYLEDSIDVILIGETHPQHDLSKLMKRLAERKKVNLTHLKTRSLDEFSRFTSERTIDLMVMPYIGNDLDDLTVYAVSTGIPVLTNESGSLPYYIEDYANILTCKNTPPAIASRIGSFLSEPEQLKTRPIHMDVQQFPSTDTAWPRFCEAISPPRPSISQAQTETITNGPLVSVCIAHHNRGDLIDNALESILAQDYQHIEIIIIDDGSTDKLSLAKLAEIETRTTRFPMRVVRQENSYLGAVRNTGIANSNGKYILFMDDDNEAMSFEVSQFVQVAESSPGDIFTCFSEVFAGDRPYNSSIERRRILYHGENLAAALLKNPYGDSNCFVRKEAVLKMNGFSEHFKVGLDDMEFFSRALVSGLKIVLVPKALYWYRINEVRMRHGQYNLFAGRYRVANALTQNLSPDLANIVYYATSMGYQHGPGGGITRKKLPARLVDWGRGVILKYPRLVPLAKYIYRKIS